jgi:hypothetical protein
MALKAVLIGPRGTLYKDGRAQVRLLDELVNFIKHMRGLGIHVGLWSRHTHSYIEHGKSVPVQDYLTQRTRGTVPFYQAGAGSLTIRSRRDSAMPILQRLGVQRHEAVLVGNEREDMLAGVNNRLLLVRPEWYPGDHDYGFEVESISELTQFCQLFGLRQHPIFWAIDKDTLQVHSMGPYSTYIPDFAAFGADARSVAKQGTGYRQFWFWMIVSSLYFSGIIHRVDFICSFPGHDPSSTGAVKEGIDAVLTTLGKCFRKDYMPDLIVRHRMARKSQTTPSDQRTFRNQINTIRLNRYPRRYDREPNQSPTSLRNRTVLVVDDFCTNGRSLDVARAYIEAAGGQAILFSWLKTISTPYLHMSSSPQLKPFEANTCAEPNSVSFSYNRHIVSRAAPAEIDRTFKAYQNWRWP